MGATFTTVYPHLHEIYFGKKGQAAKLFNDIEGISPVLAYSRKNKVSTEGGGRTMVFPITTALGSGMGAFSTQQTKAQGTGAGSAMDRKRWEVSPVTLDAMAVWTRDAILKANRGGDAGNIGNLIKEELDAKIIRCRNQLATMVCEAGWGRVGVVTAVSTTTLTISSSYANRLEIGDDLVASSAETGAVLRDSGTSSQVSGIAIDAVAGTMTLTMSTDVGTAGWAVGDTVFGAGWRHNHATTVRQVPLGVRAWGPTTAPTDTFCGLARTGIPALSAGRYDCSSASDHASAFIKLVNFAKRKLGRKVDAIITSPEDVIIMLQNAEQSKITDASGKMGPYEISFSGVGIRTDDGVIPVQSDPSFAPSTAMAGPWNSKTDGPILAYTLDLINVDDFDGAKMQRLASSAAFETRLFFDGNFVMPSIGLYTVGYNLPTS